LLITIGLAVIIARGITGPLTAMTGAMGKLAEGKLETVVPAIGRRDKIGEMADAVQIFKDNAIKVRQMTSEQEAHGRRNQREIMALNNAMEREGRGAVGSVLKRSETMQSSAQGMAAMAEETSRQSTAVAAAAEQAAANVQTVASAAEKLPSPRARAADHA
jgi:methyl-accepting chemotaxis protein